RQRGPDRRIDGPRASRGAKIALQTKPVKWNNHALKHGGCSHFLAALGAVTEFREDSQWSATVSTGPVAARSAMELSEVSVNSDLLRLGFATAALLKPSRLYALIAEVAGFNSIGTTSGRGRTQQRTKWARRAFGLRSSLL